MLWMNGHGLNWVKFTTRCYYYSKSREVSDSETIGSGTVRTSMRRSIQSVAAWSPLPMYYPGTPLAITCWYIYIFINYYLLEHRSTFDNCIVKVDYGIFNIQPSNQLSNIAFYNKRLMLSAGRRRSGFETTRLDFASALCVNSGLFFTLSRIETYVIDNVLSVKSTITLHSTAHTNHTSYKKFALCSHVYVNC